ncbi:MAG: HAD-IA family hydrolase [Gammaproteobacteria bacterium]|jgi:phosphoglycolate phosphatase|nr:HAD-IA family hydrolase [Gammaproteobacteria bacterium]
MFRLLVFDWDGTLMDSEARIVESALIAIGELGLPPRSRDAIRDIIGLGLPEAMQALYPELPVSHHVALIDRYRGHFLAEGGEPMPLFSGARETLEALHARGRVLAVATGKSRRGLDRALAETGLASLFAATRCADESRSKPDPRMLLEIMAEVGGDPAETLMIGDSEFDLQMAAGAGVAAVGVSYGVKDCERLLDYRPLTCLDAIDELPGWLEDWERSGGRP